MLLWTVSGFYFLILELSFEVLIHIFGGFLKSNYLNHYMVSLD